MTLLVFIEKIHVEAVEHCPFRADCGANPAMCSPDVVLGIAERCCYTVSIAVEPL